MRKRYFKKKIVAICLGFSMIATSITPVGITENKVYAAESAESFEIEDGVLKKYTGTKRIVTVPDGVVEIGGGAFESSVEKIILPNSVEILNDWAFSGCGYLTSIELSPNIYYIGKSAFSDCKNLQRIDLSKTKIDLIQPSTFSGCSGMSEVILPDRVVSIGVSAFNGCNHLGKINWPESLEIIGESAFWGCGSLINIELPDSLKAIGASAFCFCGGLQNVKIPAGVTVLPESLFYGATSLEKVYLPDTLEVIEDNVFNSGAGSSGSLSTIYVPESVKVIADGALNTGSFIGSSAPLREFKAFNGSYAVDYINKKKAEDSRYSKTEYVEAAYDSSITFDACGGKLDYSSKQGIIGEMYGELPTPTLKGYTFTGWYLDTAFKNKVKSTTIIKDSEITLYARWEKEKEKAPVSYAGEADDFVIEDGVLKDYIGKQSVVVIPEGVTKIEWYHSDLGFIKEIVLPESLEEINNRCFSSLSSLIRINIPKKITSISNYAFGGCSNLYEVNIEGNITNIGDNAFRDCKVLQNINLPDSLKSIGYGAFSGCISLKEINIPESVESIGEYAFTTCIGLREIKIPSKVEKLSKHLFDNCQLLSKVVLGDGLKEIEEAVFDRCDFLHDIYIPESAETISAEVFNDYNHDDFELNIYGIKPSAAYDIYELMDTTFGGTNVTFKKLKYDALISYDEQSAGAALTGKNAIVGQAYGVLPDVSKDNMVFVGWSDGDKIIKSTDIVDKENVTLYAVWKDPSEVTPPPVEEEEGTPTILPPDEEAGEADKEYIEISTPEDLNNIRNNLSANYKLVADIDLSEVTTQGGVYCVGGYGWQPLGSSLDGVAQEFTGELDGNGHKISGLNIYGEVPYNEIGLFARIEGGTVKNLVLENVDINISGKPAMTGILAGYCGENEYYDTPCSVSGITTSGKLKFNGEENAPSRNICFGGILGYLGKGKIADSHNRVDVKYYSNVEEKPTALASRFLGGITGYLREGEISCCDNTADVSIYREFYGQFKSEHDEGDFVQEAFSGLDVYDITGGICGVADVEGDISECYNTGNISNYMFNTYLLFSVVINDYSTAMSGGIVGYLRKSTGVKDCYNTGKVYSMSERDTTIIPPEIKNSDSMFVSYLKLLDENTCTPPFQNAHGYSGGIVGHADSKASGPVVNCYNTGGLYGMSGDTYPISSGDVPAYYCRYLESDTFKQGSQEREDSLITCKSFSDETMLEEDTYRTFDFANTWLFVEGSEMKQPLLYNNLESKVSDVKFTSNTLNKSEYKYGESLDLSGFEVSFSMEGIEKPFVFTVPNTRECGYDCHKEGEQHLTLSYFGVTESFDVTVAPQHIHEYEFVYDWNDDDKTCVVSRVCNSCGDSAIVQSKVDHLSNKDVEPDYVSEGKEVYQVTATYKQKEYTDEHEITIPIKEKADISSCKFSDIEKCTYNGKENKPWFSLYNEENYYLSSSYYDVVYENNIDAGVATITCTAKEGNVPYKGSISTTFEILKANQSFGVYIFSPDDTMPAGYIGKVEIYGDIYGDIKYESSDETVATVDENGLIKGIKEGVVTITVSTDGNNNYDEASNSVEYYVSESDIKPTSEPGKTPGSSATSEPGKTPGSSESPEPGKTPGSSATPEPGKTSGPSESPEPSVTPDNPISEDFMPTLDDVLEALKMALGIEATSEEVIAKYDVVDTGNDINLDDVLLLLKVALGIENMPTKVQGVQPESFTVAQIKKFDKDDADLIYKKYNWKE